MVKIDFERGVAPIIFRDALHLPDDHSFSEAEIEAMKDERYKTWQAFVEAASIAPPIEPAIEEPVIEEPAIEEPITEGDTVNG